MSAPPHLVVLGAGIAGLTTAAVLAGALPELADPAATSTPPSATVPTVLAPPATRPARITLLARDLPGDPGGPGYCSPQAGANWASFEPSPGKSAAADWDRVALARLAVIARTAPESGVARLPLRVVWGGAGGEQQAKGNDGKGNLWYANLLGGSRPLDKDHDELPSGAAGGVEMPAGLVIATTVYLSWLLSRLLRAGVTVVRREYKHIDELTADFPDAIAIFNCTGLGARDLGGVADDSVYPTKGQTLLLAEPKQPIGMHYTWHQPSRFGPHEFSHIFPRPLGAGVIIGGVRLGRDAEPTPDMALAARIKQRACELCPQLGKPDEVQVIRHNVGFRPSRVSGGRVAVERRGPLLLVHNYGASGSGYQSSWGMAEKAVELFWKDYRGAAKL